MALPCVLFSSSCNTFTPQDFVKDILKVSELPPPDLRHVDIYGYKWDIHTKYYTTQVHLCTADKRTIGDQAFAESVEAFVHFFDPNVPSSFDLAKAWLPYLNQLEPQVQMLVCKCSKDSDVISRQNSLVWCIENGFELVELEPEPDSDDEDNDFPETKGLPRIIQALHAHTWPNLELKDSPPIQSPLVRQMMKEQHSINKEQEDITCNLTTNSQTTMSASSSDTNTSVLESPSPSEQSKINRDNVLRSQVSPESKSTEPNTEGKDKEKNVQLPPDKFTEVNSKETSSNKESLPAVENIDWSSFIGAVAADSSDDTDPSHAEKDLDVDEFEKLFMELKVMKDRAENLPPSERKKYAEKVAMSFWDAIGGDPDELGDLDDD